MKPKGNADGSSLPLVGNGATDEDDDDDDDDDGASTLRLAAVAGDTLGEMQVMRVGDLTRHGES